VNGCLFWFVFGQAKMNIKKNIAILFYNMTVLLHICCGPCTTYPLEVLKAQGIKASGFFYNPNIHPYREFMKRIEAVEQLAARENLHVDYHREYGLREYLRQVVFNEESRCSLCYDMRHKIPFYYHDFREGWQQGIDMSKEMGLYRQSYCGCIYSEQERYDKRFKKVKTQVCFSGTQ
jgi:predicted adenine nucleotide alpha hydrolase (AANH) superfamily ATPase